APRPRGRPLGLAASTRGLGLLVGDTSIKEPMVAQLPRLSRGTSVALASLLLVQLATWQATRAQSCNVRLSLDNPEDGAQVIPEQTVSGWAVDLAATSGTGIDNVVVSLDGPLDSPDYRLVGVATYGAAREDIAQNLGDERYTPSGFVL